jgi:hypothetical protein
MRNAKFLGFLFFLLIANLQFAAGQACFFNKVVIWGHKLNTHTHSYIHYGYYKAFKRLGYETRWLDDYDDVTGIDFSNTLFLTEGQVDQKIPLRTDCYYILHNCDLNKYFKSVNHKKIIKLFVYLKCCEYGDNLKMQDYVWYNLIDQSIHMPWATDLLPDEIDANKQLVDTDSLQRQAVFIGSCAGYDAYGNLNEIELFKKACFEQKFSFIGMGGYGNSTGFIGINSNIMLIKESYLAPAIQSKYQCDFGYIPCRIFKNISYGKLGITNNKYVYDLFKQKIVYNKDCYQLFFDAYHRMQTITQDELFEQINFVRDHHTYLNRINDLLRFLTMVEGY